MKYRKFGNLGFEVSALGFGTMRFPLTPGSTGDADVDEQQAIDMMRKAIDGGVNYIDTAYIYHSGNSEKVIAKALRDGYREKVRLADKSPVWMIKSPDDFDRLLKTQLERLETEYIDLYMLHSITRDSWQDILRFGLLEKMEQKKAQGVIGHIGFSFHDDYDVFVKTLDGYDKWEYCMLQMNYAGLEHQATLKGLQLAASRGLGIIVMEPLLGGKLVNLPPAAAAELSGEKSPAEWALDYLWGLPEVGVVVSGMSSEEQVAQNLEYAARSSVGMLSDSEIAMLMRVAEKYRDNTLIPCTECGYCLPCPAGIRIPSILEAYNRRFTLGFEHALNKYQESQVSAKECTACGECEQNCPQHIKVSELMPMIGSKF